jgi:hypothetical protein
MSSDIAGVAAVMTNPLEQLSRLRQSRAFGPQLDRVLAQDPIVTPNTLLQSHLTWETTPRIIKLNGFPRSPAQVYHLKMSPDILLADLAFKFDNTTACFRQRISTPLFRRQSKTCGSG